jgi:2,5-diketo-D-gluconate reductase A
VTELSPSLELRGGSRIPQLGLGVYKISNDEAPDAVASALEIGYRHFDTATLYGNEQGVGEGIRRSGIDRGDVFVTTKVWQDAHGYDETLRSFDDSLEALGFDEVDLYLIHWPAPLQDRYVETWRALLRLRDEGRAHSIGVANFKQHHLERLIDETGEAPEANQVELHLRFQQPELREFHREHGILTQAWSPLGRGKDLDQPAVLEVAGKHGCTPAQAIIAWHLAIGNVVIPKSVRPERQRENFDAIHVALDEADLAAIAAIDTGVRAGKDPDEFE